MSALGSDDALLIDGFRFDPKAGGLFRLDSTGNAALVPLGSRALDLLALLARRRGEAVSKDEIFNEVWSGRAVEEANLNVQISKLRHILDQGRAQGSCIQTLTGYGYRFVADVKPGKVAALLPQAIADDKIAVSTAVLAQGEEAHPPNVWTVGAAHALQRSQAMRYGVPLAAVGIVALLAILVDLKAPWLSEPRDAPALSLVVLPFADLSDDHKTRNLAEGIVQDVTTELSRVGQITVVAPTTASAYAREPIGVKGIGRALRVRYVLQGSVEGTGDQVRITAQLSDAATTAILWAHRYDGSAEDRLGLEDEVTGHIATALIVAMVVTVVTKAWPSFSSNGLSWFGPGGEVDAQLRAMRDGHAK